MSVFIFNSSLSPKAIIAILCIIGFSALIMINKKINTGIVKPIWLPLSIGAFFCWGLLSLASKYLLLIGVPIPSRLFYLSLFVSGFILVEMKQKQIKLGSINQPQMIVLIGIGILSAAFNYFMQEGFNTAPNIGYVNAINASSISIVSLFSAFIFHDELTTRKIIGILGVTLGLILLVT